MPRKRPTKLLTKLHGITVGYCSGTYIKVKAPVGHPRAFKDGYIYEHMLIAEIKLGRFLTPEEEIHHRDLDTTNNDPENLIVCKDHTEHMEMERRERAFRECGNADWWKCGYCGKYDAPENLYQYNPSNGAKRRGFHLSCRHKYNREHWLRTKAKVVAC